MNQIMHVSTSALKTHDQFDFWRSVINGRGITMTLDKKKSEGFIGHIKALQLSEKCIISHIFAAENSVVRNKQHVNQDTQGYYLVYLPLNSDLVIQSLKQTYHVKMGEIALYNTEHPAIAHQGARNTLSLKIPKSALPNLSSEHAVLTLPSNHPKLVYLRHCMLHNGFKLFANLSKDLAHSEYELTSAVSECFNVEQPSSKAKSKVKHYLFQQVLKLVSQQSHRKITIAELATTLGISEPYVYKVLAFHNVTFRQLVTEQRLRAAIIKMSENKRLNFAQIAQDVGFKNQSHFCTSFNKQFAVAPKQFSTLFMLND